MFAQTYTRSHDFPKFQSNRLASKEYCTIKVVHLIRLQILLHCFDVHELFFGGQCGLPESNASQAYALEARSTRYAMAPSRSCVQHSFAILATFFYSYYDKG